MSNFVHDGLTAIVSSWPHSFLRRHAPREHEYARQTQLCLPLPYPSSFLHQRLACSTLFSALAFCAGSAHSAGLGPVQLHSALNAPLRASIALLGPDTESIASACVKARVASLDGDILAPLRVEIQRSGPKPLLLLTSSRNINEPLASLSVEVDCGAGIQREYQLLLDPPFLMAAASAALPPSAEQDRTPIAPDSANRSAQITPDTLIASAVKPAAPRRGVVRPVPATITAPPALPSNTRTLQPGERSVLRLSAPASGTPSRVELILSTVLSEPATVLSPLPPTESSLTGDTVEAAAQMKRAAAQMEALQAKMNAMELELVRLRQGAATVQPVARPAVPVEADQTRWFVALGLLLLLAMAWLGWRVRRLRHGRNNGLNWNDETGKETIRKATQLTLARAVMKRQPDPAGESPMSADVKAGLQAALDKNYGPPMRVVPAGELTARASQKSAEAEFLGSEEGQAPSAPTPPPAAPEPGPVAAPMAFEFPGKKEYVTTGAILQTPFDAHVGSRGRPLMTEAEEIVDARAQAEFWMSLQDPQRAVQVLELYTYEHVQRPESTLPWLLLFDLYRDLGYQAKYEDLYRRYRGRFNSKVPKWGEDPAEVQTGGLESFPRLAQKACDLWNTPDIVPYLESLLLDDRDGKREGFELSVYDDILFLAELACEVQKLPRLALEPVTDDRLLPVSTDPWSKAE